MNTLVTDALNLKRLVESNVVGFAIVIGTRVVDANEKYLDLLGHSAEDLQARRIDWLKTVSVEYLECAKGAYSQLRDSGFCGPLQMEYTGASGGRVAVLIGAAVLACEPELTFICFAADCAFENTPQQKLRTAEQQMDALREELQTFGYIAAHDLKSPLTTIAGLANLLARRMGERLDAESQSTLQDIRDTAVNLKALVGHLVEYANLSFGSLVLQPVDCMVVFRWAKMSLHAQIMEADAKLTCDPLPVVEADLQLTRVFQNLFENSIKYRGERKPEIHVSAERVGDNWTLAFRDNGIGFDMRHADRVFRVFQRLHTGGTYGGAPESVSPFAGNWSNVTAERYRFNRNRVPGRPST